jgi:hypothetical protein
LAGIYSKSAPQYLSLWNMGPYAFCLALGVTGLVVMALLGFGHHGDTGAHGHAGHGHGGHAGNLGHGGHAGHHGHDTGAGHGGHAGHSHELNGAAKLAGLLSPRVLFSFLVGVGATGMLARSVLVEPLLVAAALVGGVAFERFMVGPIWKFIFRFESKPALMLESLVMEEAEAMMDFDAQGQGLIKLELDGQVVQLLGTLAPDDRASARRIRRGDVLRIEDFDAAKNRCTVSYAGPRLPEALP